MSAISTGHPQVTAAAREILEQGGNAADATVGAVLAACVAEPVLASLGGGGLAVVCRPGEQPVMLDFWVRSPACAAQGDLVELNWSGGARQPFRVGPGSVGLWRLPAGLEALSLNYGSISLAECAGPAAQLASSGVVLNQSQAEWMRLLHQVHLRGPGSALTGTPPSAGQVFCWPGLQGAIELFAGSGASAFAPGGEFFSAAQKLLGRPHSQGLAEAACPVDALQMSCLTVGQWEVYLPPLPSISGSMVSQALSGLSGLSGDELASALRRMNTLPAAGPSTTSVSVVDSGGLSVSAVVSNGSGSGVFLEGVQLNNVAGEVELLESSGELPGGMLPTRMCPVFARSGEHWVSFGSGGSERITSATFSFLAQLALGGSAMQQAVLAPRCYFDGSAAQAEPGSSAGQALQGQGVPVNWWSSLDAYFGGINLVAGSPLMGFADPRRQGSAWSD